MSLFPLPSTSTDRAFEFDSGIIIYGVALVFVAGALAGTLVLDREAGVRHLLYMGGLRVPVYYIGTLTHDMACYYVSAILSVILAAAFGTQPIGGNGVGIFILLLIEFVPAMTLFAYLLSFLFSKAETAYRIVPNMLVFLSILPNIAVQIVLSQSESTAKIIHSVLSVLSPSYGLVGSMTFMNYHYALEKVETGHPPTESSYFSTIVMFNIIVFAAQIVVLAWLLYVIEKYRYARAEDGNASSSMKLRDCCDNHSAAIEPARDDAAGSAEAADSDVEEAAADAARHVRQLASGERLPTVSIATHDLYKEFRLPDRSIKRAVDEVSFEVKAGEAFALLGPNGAGKTTTIRILTGEERATRGEGFIAGHNIRTNLLDAFTSTGLCPQRNALWENLSVYEHLLLFARVRGYPGPRQRAVATPSDHLKDDLLESGIGTADQVADRMIRLFGIEEYRNKLVRQLSGGTKRKLSAAIALCSVPPVVFMDEPSSGMDVKTRRGMWDCLADLVRSRCAVLTTHSLEEAEALCSVVGIMINGRMRCIGTPQHLKNKFGGGWRLEVKCNPGDDGERAAHDLVVQVSPQAELEESIFGRRVYTLPRESKQAAHELFAFFEEARSAGKIRDYALGQSSLEQVFLRLANEQVDEAHP